MITGFTEPKIGTMDRFTAMHIFTEVARQGGFAPAARSLRMSTTAVSRSIGELESHLGVRLLHRTTRRTSLTDPGVAYLARCNVLLEELADLERSVSDRGSTARGRVRITAGVSFAQEQLDRRLPRFLRDHPEVELELVLDDRHLDLLRERIDVALRIGRMPDSTLVARKLAPCRHVACSSAEYLEHAPPLRTPLDLREHACIIDTNQPGAWWFEGPEGEQRVEVHGRYTANSAHAAREAAIAGLGIAYLPTFVGGQALARRELVPVLAGFEAATVPVYAAYPHARYLAGAVRALVDFLARELDAAPWDTWLERPAPPIKPLSPPAAPAPPPAGSHHRGRS